MQWHQVVIEKLNLLITILLIHDYIRKDKFISLIPTTNRTFLICEDNNRNAHFPILNNKIKQIFLTAYPPFQREKSNFYL